MKEDDTTWLARGLAELYRDDIQKLLAGSGIGLATVAGQGVLALDVGYGPEICAFSQFNPDPFVATEPITSYDESRDINTSLKMLKQIHPNLNIIRQFPVPAIKTAAEAGHRFGLITRLRMLPKDVESPDHDTFFRQALALLKPGGVMIVSWDHPYPEDTSFGVNLIRAFYRIPGESPGMTILNCDIVWDTSPGGLVLVAQKHQ